MRIPVEVISPQVFTPWQLMADFIASLLMSNYQQEIKKAIFFPPSSFIQVFLFGGLRNVFTLWRRDEIDRITQKLGDIHHEFADRINFILERLTQLTARIFDFSPRGFSAETILTEKSQFWLNSKKTP